MKAYAPALEISLASPRMNCQRQGLADLLLTACIVLARMQEMAMCW